MTRRAALVEMLTEGRALDSLEALRIMTRTMLARCPTVPTEPATFCSRCGLECETTTMQTIGCCERQVSACCAKETTTTPTEGPYR